MICIRVAFQGEIGAYSEEAALKYFGNSIVTLPSRGLKDVFNAVETQKADYGIVPIENSIEGNITQTYDLLLNSNLNIVGEVIQRIVHCLISSKNSYINHVKTVYSHPQALGQCRDFLDRLACEVMPTYDTAGSVKMIKEKHLKYSAAIASERSAQIYGMEILAKGIESNKNNFTRFFIIAKHEAKPTRNDKTSIAFVTKHAPSSLYTALKTFALGKINLTNIQSRPVLSKPWEYSFYVDCEGHKDGGHMKKALNNLNKVSSFVKILGSYPKGK